MQTIKFKLHLWMMKKIHRFRLQRAEKNVQRRREELEEVIRRNKLTG